MISDEVVRTTSILNRANTINTVNNIETKKCFCCGCKADYQLMYIREQAYVAWCQSGYKGINYIVCKKCFELQVKANDFIFLLVKFLRKTILRG